MDAPCACLLLIHLIAVDLLWYVQYVQRYELDGAVCLPLYGPPHSGGPTVLRNNTNDLKYVQRLLLRPASGTTA